jgi:NarL family two-component system sensor histidine kinase LiaS
VPIRDEDEKMVLGVLGVAVPVPTDIRGVIGTLLELLPLLAFSLLLFTLGAGAVGTIFGFLTSRGLVRRLNRISEAADNWSQGDFSVFVRESGGDELSRLSQRMNLMAEQLQNLLETRNQLAILEERNRLARDLHDSAKQLAFAASAQLGAARALLPHDPEAAARHLADTEELIYALRQELTTLINELRPPALEEHGLAHALREYVEEWSQREGIDAEVLVQGERFVSLAVEQILFRIVQEALSNVARHSRAKRVEVSLIYRDGHISLTTQDDGRGFEVSKTSGGFGLQSMRERAESLPGGRLTVTSQPGEGTCIEVQCDDS